MAYLPAPSLFFLVLLHEWNVIPSDEFRAGFSLSQPLSTISSIQSSKHLRKKPLSRESIVAVSPETCASRVVITTSAIHWKQLGHVNQSVCLHQVARPRQILVFVFVFFGKANNASRKKNRRAKKETLNK